MRFYTKLFLALSLTLFPCALLAKQPADSSLFQKGVALFMEMIDNRNPSDIDPSFIGVPEHDWLITATTNFAGLFATVKGKDIPTFGNINASLHSNVSGKVGVGAGFRGLYLAYSFDMTKGYSKDLNLTLYKQRFGVEFRSHSTDRLSGKLSASILPGIALPISKGDTRLKATILDGYYVFNSKHYSLPAAMTQGLIQKRSSGSVTAYALFMSGKLEAKDPVVAVIGGGLESMEFYQAGAGIGYGYNFTPNQGKFLLHLSAAPMLVFFNKNIFTMLKDIDLPDGSSFLTEISKLVKTKHKVFLTGIARAAIVYRLNSHVYMAAKALINDIRFSTESNVKLHMEDWVANFTVGVRF